ncbi:hypothetical protein [Granulicoccus phenolivorans]|uniref:hypothetical protein n=1 Tax=Granulicoccus phenolivorans TaxID=266854 RepID=UPI000400B123|nr:hypothetical protein [Granulicoccus phenolivorans]
MPTPKNEVAYSLDQRGWIDTRGNPRLARFAGQQVAAGRLVRLLRGIYAAPDHAADPSIALRALQHHDPNAVFTGLTAAHLTLWPQNPARLFPIEAASLTRPSRTGELFRWERRRVPPDWICEPGGLRCTRPELTAIDLIPRAGGDFVDSALRQLGPGRQGDFLDSARRALADHPHRRGNAVRTRILDESRAFPWSPAERVLHRLLRSEGILGWTANYLVRCGDRTFLIDVALPESMVGYEVDGYEYHASREAFEADCYRHNELALAGWRIFRFSWRMLTEDVDYVRDIVRRTAVWM